MSPRTYRQQRRAESAVETRDRIVRATAELHAEKGVAATTFRDIAARADVGIGTVYHHFPSYDEVITACGAFTLGGARPPQPSIFDGAATVEERLRILVAEVFAFYQRIPHFARIRAERHQFAALDAAYRAGEDDLRALVAAALRPLRSSARLRALAFALLDATVYESLKAAGLSHAAAVDEITTTLIARSQR
jgi:AcrR family transcriptional regulator